MQITPKQQQPTGEDEAVLGQSRPAAPAAADLTESPRSMARILRQLRTAFIVVIPWAIIGSLVYIAFFVHPGSIVEAPATPPVTPGDRFYGATSVQGDTFWVVGNFGKIIKSSNAGSSWTIQPTPARFSLQSVVAWNKDDAIAVGDNSTVVRTSDGGAHWLAVAGVPQVSEEFNKLLQAKISSDGTVWVVGEQGTVLVSRDKGATWTRVAPVQDTTFNGLAISGDTVWVAGEFGTILVSQDVGATWTAQTSGTDSTLTAIQFSDASTGVAVGLDGTVLVTNDGGAQWTPAAMPTTTTQFYAVAYSKNTWFASGDSGTFASASSPAESWVLHSLGEKDFSWYVDALPIGKTQGWLLVGSGVRLLKAGPWAAVSSATGVRP